MGYLANSTGSETALLVGRFVATGGYLSYWFSVFAGRYCRTLHLRNTKQAIGELVDGPAVSASCIEEICPYKWLLLKEKSRVHRIHVFLVIIFFFLFPVLRGFLALFYVST